MLDWICNWRNTVSKADTPHKVGRLQMKFVGENYRTRILQLQNLVVSVVHTFHYINYAYLCNTTVTKES